jgi:hypothetical protein
MPHVLIVEGKPRTLPHRNGFQSILVSIAKLGSVMTMALLALSASQKIMVNTTKSTLKVGGFVRLSALSVSTYYASLGSNK